MKRLTPVWIFIFIFVAGAVYLPGLSKYLKLKRKEEQLVKDIQRFHGEIDALKQEEHLLRTNVTRLEEVVREELGLVKPGEVIYRVAEQKLPAAEDPQNANVSSKKPAKA